MSNMNVSDNRIKARFYNLEINGEIVEVMLSSRMANILRDEYRNEGFAVDKVEAFTLTNGGKVVGENIVEANETVDPEKKFLTPSATEAKIQRDRNNMRAKNNRKARSQSWGKDNGGVRYTSYGRDRNSLLHEDYLMALQKQGYRVLNRLTNEVWFGFQKEITERIFYYLNNLGGKMDDLDIKFLGSK